ncbi:hypothetical protein HPB49_007536 [Dermacentor silvarum]|uniref:Uncharacterized protein n=1 Tax=Dermacentor silvarum TaxID=543639 RepID=A0ACB8DXZ6_DERSI|nr:hypothetical protein HPB49_007536 [Dermacentor silvarum]
MGVTVEGQRITQEEMDTSKGWKEVRHRRSHRQTSQHRESTLSPTWPEKRNDNPKKGRLEQEEDIICPNNYQNILIIRTSDQEHNNKYQEVSRINIRDKFYETNAYETAPDMTAKGVIRGIPLDEGPRDITAAVVTNKNPTAIAAKRIRQRCSDAPCTGNKWISVTNATDLDTEQMYVPTQTTRFVLDVEQQTQTKSIGAKLSASYAARTIQPRLRRAKPNSRSASSLNRGNGRDCNENYNENMKMLSQEKTGQSLVEGQTPGKDDRDREQGLLPPPDPYLGRAPGHRGHDPDPDLGPRTRPPTSASTTTTVSWADVVDGKRPGTGGDTAINNKIKELKHENAQLRIMLARMSDEIKSLKDEKSQLNQVTSAPHASTKDPTKVPDDEMDEGDNPPPLKRKEGSPRSRSHGQNQSGEARWTEQLLHIVLRPCVGLLLLPLRAAKLARDSEMSHPRLFYVEGGVDIGSNTGSLGVSLATLDCAGIRDGAMDIANASTKTRKKLVAYAAFRRNLNAAGQQSSSLSPHRGDQPPVKSLQQIRQA